MIGIFDSGVGGLSSFSELRRLLPRADMIYLADRRNSPYGTKRKDELLALVKEDIRRLRALGADHVLVACCTASTVCPLLSREEARGILPIIDLTAEHLSVSGAKKVTVIATRHTARARAFSEAITRLDPTVSVTELEAQELVGLVEGGARDGNLKKEASDYLDSLTEKIKKLRPDALVLGCTHFSHLEREISARLPRAVTVSPARLGALALRDRLGGKSENEKEAGSGKSLYTE